MDYMIWDVDRIIFRIYESVGLRWYSMLFLAGILLADTGMSRMTKSEGKDPKLIDTLVMYVVIGLILGARLAHCIFYHPILFL